MELICLMHQSKVYGHLIVNGKAPTDKQLSILTAIPLIDVARGLTELEENGVFSRTEDGTIFSRGMVRDEEKHVEAANNGHKGQLAKARKAKANNGASRVGSRPGSSTPSDSESEEEIESEKTLPVIPPKLGGPKTELPEDWEPEPFDPKAEPAAHRIASGWDKDRRQSEIDSFRSNHRKRRSRYSDWQDVWAGWVRNAEKFDNRDRRESEERAKPAAPRDYADIVLEEYANRKPAEPVKARAGAK
jgi:hypothetical protein